MTDQKLTTSQDILDQHYEEVEALQRENARLRVLLAQAANNMEVLGIYVSGSTRRKLDLDGCISRYRNLTNATVGEGIIAGLEESVEHAQTVTDMRRELCKQAAVDLGPRWSKKS